MANSQSMERPRRGTQGLLFDPGTWQKTRSFMPLLRLSEAEFAALWKNDCFRGPLGGRLNMLVSESVKRLAPFFGLGADTEMPELKLTRGGLTGKFYKLEDRYVVTADIEANCSLAEAEITCAHETGHYLHFLRDGEERFGKHPYDYKELVAALSSLVVFNSMQKLGEAEGEIRRRPDWEGRWEHAALGTLRAMGVSADDALRLALAYPDAKAMAFYEWYKSCLDKE
jgi:hypothetical protein